MPILLGTPKLGDTTLGMPVGVWYMQTDVDETAHPDFQEHLAVIQRPIISSEYDYIACNTFIVSDNLRGAESYADMTTRWEDMIDAAKTLRTKSTSPFDPPYDIRMSVGYIGKMFNTADDTDIEDFVNAICDISDVDNIVRSWHVIDEPVAAAELGSGPYEDDITAERMGEIVQVVHETQVDRGRNWPFIYAEGGDGRENAAKTESWWKVVSQDREYDPANLGILDQNGAASVNDATKIQAYADEMANVAHNGVAADLIYAPFYYAWTSNNWRYSVLPPWRKWRYIYEWWTDLTAGTANRKFPVFAVIEGAAQSTSGGAKWSDADDAKSMLQGYIDMHNNMRMVKDFGFTGVYMWGWTTSSTDEQDLWLTKSHWSHDNTNNTIQTEFYVSTAQEQWGEAVSNEMWRNLSTSPTSEEEHLDSGDDDAIPSSSGLVATVWDDFTPTGGNAIDGFWIQFDLHQSGRVWFTIENDQSTVVRVLDWGFRNDTDRPTNSITTADVNALAPGRYRNLVTLADMTLATRRPDTGAISGDLNGTAQYWDLRDNDNALQDPGVYTVRMYREGSEVGSSVTATIPA